MYLYLLIKEVFNLIFNFHKVNKLGGIFVIKKSILSRIVDFKNLLFNNDEFLKLSKHAKKLWILDLILGFLEQISIQLPSVVLALATSLITKSVPLAIVTLIVWVLFNPIGTVISSLKVLNFDALKLHIGQKVQYVSNNILNFTRDKVEVQKDGRKEKMPNVIVLNTITQYLINTFQCKNEVIYCIFNIILFLFSLVSMISLANLQVENTFILYLIISVVVMFSIILQSKRVKYSERFHTISRPIDDDIENASRDLQEIEPMSSKHFYFMLDRLSTYQEKKLQLTLSELKKKSLYDIIVSLVNSFGVICVVLFICLENGVTGLTPEKFLNAIAISQLFSKIVSNVGFQIRRIFNLFDTQMEYEKYENDYKKIIEEYYENVSINEKTYPNNSLVIKPFSYTYRESNFNLKSKDSITLKRGNLTLLKGDSGVGKSTLVKILAGDIKINKSSEKLISVKYFNDKSKLGSGSLLEEITLEPKEDVDFKRLFEIVNGLQLSKFKTIDDLSNVSCKELSNGLMQRALIARTLYNLGNSDLVCIDEPIGSLDVYNARKVVEFIKEYCNREKDRFIIICTHQYRLINDLIDKCYNIIAIDSNKSEVICKEK